MNYWEPGWPAVLLTIALFLMGAIVIGELIGWAPTNDASREQKEQSAENRKAISHE